LELLEEKTDLVGARELEIKSNMWKTITIETTTHQFQMDKRERQAQWREPINSNANSSKQT
jgi:hypothetical protein